MTADIDELIDPDDRAYVAAIEDAAHRDVVVSTLLRYRVPEQLAAGDPVPDVTLTRLDPLGTVALGDLMRDRPVLLVFGSYT